MTYFLSWMGTRSPKQECEWWQTDSAPLVCSNPEQQSNNNIHNHNNIIETLVKREPPAQNQS